MFTRAERNDRDIPVGPTARPPGKSSGARDPAESARAAAIGWCQGLPNPHCTRAAPPAGAGCCLRVPDLILSKYVTRMPKDYRFIKDVIRRGLVEPATLVSRLEPLSLPPDRRAAIRW